MTIPSNHRTTSGPDSTAESSVKKTGFVDLPLETQKEIFTWIKPKDLLSLQLVSSHFHSLASARLYSELRFILTHADAPNYYSKPNTRLAYALHTFATSSHDYAQYVKNFSLELSERDADDVKQRILSKYHFEEEATKYLNTALLLMLRKAATLETFIWDPSIELTGYVYQALSSINTLQHLRIRLDTWAIPRTASIVVSQSPAPHAVPQQGTLGYPTQPPFSSTYSSAASSISSALTRTRRANPHITATSKRKFSQFQNLRCLEVLGIDDHLVENLPELAACVSACSGTLKCLTLSLSRTLAQRARKSAPPPPPINPPVDADMDEDDDDMTPPPPDSPIILASANDADIRKEKAEQESVLAVLFGLEPASKGDKIVDRTLKATASSIKSKEDVNRVFMGELRKIMTKLIQSKSGAYGGVAKDKQVLELLEKAADKYLQSDGKKVKKSPAKASKSIHSQPENPHLAPGPAALPVYVPANLAQEYSNYVINASGEYDEFEKHILAKNAGLSAFDASLNTSNIYTDGTFSPYTPSASAIMGYQQPSGSHVNLPFSFSSSNGGHQHLHVSSSSTNPSKKSKAWPTIKQEMANQSNKNASLKGSPPAVDDQEDTEDSESEDMVELIEEQSRPATPAYFPAIESESRDRVDTMDVDIEHPDVIDSENDADQEMLIDQEAPTETKNLPRPNAFFKSPTPVEAPVTNEEKPFINIKSKRALSPAETMQEYIRKKHGFHLDEFSLYLIPIKASVMARALHLPSLQRLTLLNVGQQGGFWTLVDKIQKESTPIQLKYIHTDDVSLAFLNCVANLTNVTELFMMKRSNKETESSSPKTYATLTDIRVLALRKHVATLKRLVIMNNDDESWDLDAKVLRLLTARGEALTELTMSASADDYHILMQNLRGLKNLFALHVLAIRTNDQCHSVIRECRKFTIDTLTHCPELKLKYLAMSGMVCQLARRPSSAVRSKVPQSKGKGKGKEKAPVDVSMGDSVDALTDSENFSEIESGGLEMAVVKQLKFSDVECVKIFAKEIRSGKL